MYRCFFRLCVLIKGRARPAAAGLAPSDGRACVVQRGGWWGMLSPKHVCIALRGLQLASGPFELLGRVDRVCAGERGRVGLQELAALRVDP